MGIPEDPVTGSAQCALGPFWAARLGRSELRARQVSARVGDIAVAVQPDGSYLWSSSPAGGVQYRTDGWTIIGHVSL